MSNSFYKKFCYILIIIIAIIAFGGSYIEHSNYDKGFDEGYDKGYEEGHMRGYNQGYEEGREYGYEAGLEDSEN